MSDPSATCCRARLRARFEPRSPRWSETAAQFVDVEYYIRIIYTPIITHYTYHTTNMIFSKKVVQVPGTAPAAPHSIAQAQPGPPSEQQQPWPPMMGGGVPRGGIPRWEILQDPDLGVHRKVGLSTPSLTLSHSCSISSSFPPVPPRRAYGVGGSVGPFAVSCEIFPHL